MRKLASDSRFLLTASLIEFLFLALRAFSTSQLLALFSSLHAFLLSAFFWLYSREYLSAFSWLDGFEIHFSLDALIHSGCSLFLFLAAALVDSFHDPLLPSPPSDCLANH